MVAVHLAGHSALDFVGTITERGTADQEELGTTDDLARWFVDAKVVSEQPRVDADGLAAARAVREHLLTAITAWRADATVPRSTRDALNRRAASPPVAPRMQSSGSVVVSGDLDACLSTVVRGAFALMATVDPAHVRECADDTCTHLFLDISRAQARRWCEMRSCGTRNKQRQFRARRG